jgi:CheY-like chemotaxis protein
MENQVNNLKILIAEDNQALRIILCGFVRCYSREILYAATGVEAIEICKNNPDIDLILIDFHMPVMNGCEAARQIRTFNKEVIIILETADSFSDETTEFSREGINDYFYKPYNRISLNNLVARYFNM